MELDDEVVLTTKNNGRTWEYKLLSGITLPQFDMEEGEIPIGCELPERVRNRPHEWWCCSDIDTVAKWATITPKEFDIWLKELGFNK